MFSKLVERAEIQLANSLPFVLYRKPKEQQVFGLFQADDALHYVTDFTETGFAFAPFDSASSIILLQGDERWEEEYRPHELVYKHRNVLSELESSGKKFHVSLVQKGIREIGENTIRKVVLSRKIVVNCTPSSLLLFEKLLANYDNAFCYLWYHPKIGIWLGATPEILLATVNSRITTMSLAGTQKYTGDDTPEWGSKEREEQQLVTTYIADALKGKVDNLKIGERETVRAGNLMHLRTKVMADYIAGDLGGIVEALHPTPAVCGLPLMPSKTFILANENYDREYYTGYLGELNMKRELARTSERKNQEHKAYKTIKTTTTLYVNLRCMQLKRNTAIIYVGGGVTKDSIPELEWEETRMKAKTMLKVLSGD